MPWRNQLDRRINRVHPSLRICFLVLSYFGSTAAHANNVGVPFSTADLPFVIADFDGDQNPDLASVQSESDSSSLASYEVRLQLSAAGQQSVRLVGPSGGLRIASRDMNGDHIPDLIVSSAWREETLAVLVNDGRGGFSLADPSSFPTSSGESGKSLNCKLPQQTDTVATAPRLPVGDFSGSKYLLHPSLATGSLPRANFATHRSLLLGSLLGRAPPTPSCA
jgi:hypothetical protein